VLFLAGGGEDGIEALDVRPPLHVGFKATDRAVGAGDYGIPGHLPGSKGAASLLRVSEYMNILSEIGNRAGGDYEVGCRQKDARFERPLVF